MILTLQSLFRDCAGEQITRWAQQAKALKEALDPGVTLECVVVEGDSKDRTAWQLRDEARRCGLALAVVKHNVGVPRFGSCVDPTRLKALSSCLNAAFEATPPDSDWTLYVESDLIWDAETMVALLRLAVSSPQADIIAPFTMVGPTVFYDIWGFRKSGHCFGSLPPYARGLDGQLFELDSVGSCVIMESETARRVRVQDNNAFVGWCADAKAKGYRIFTAPWLRIQHPA